ncbi:MAG: hypothetical protein K2L62_04995 [Muribaculaceae bacterium]|nr:hypothetical protein [Muribaculaceae bacterium]MDE6628325.1 hypothetical protein [Muribaculaceae bacterium]
MIDSAPDAATAAGALFFLSAESNRHDTRTPPADKISPPAHALGRIWDKDWGNLKKFHKFAV